jgi:DNA helicase HerA-like ATPase
MLDNNKNALIALSGGKEIHLFSRMANRHGMITGATGTGKTCTLQNMAETFSSMGVSVFATDIKGDLSGVSKQGGGNVHFQKSVETNQLAAKGFEYKGFPVCFWDIFGEEGHPLRTTVSEMGPLLLSRLLDLNDTQSGVLSLTFKIADDENLLLLDLKDLRKMLEHVANERSKYMITYGNISPASIGAIQRSLLMLEEQGGTHFFGEPAFDVFDLLQTQGGRGIINILAADKLIRSPKVYTSFLLYLLSELYEQLPETGDLDKPKLVFFFDEAHLLFNGISKVLLEKIEQVVRLIRSKGVGVYFCTQSPLDIPDTILGQMGNRVQHALRAFTPRDQKAVSTAAKTFRQNPAFDAEKVITELSVGEALISFLDEKGSPEIVERAVIIPPEGQAGPVTLEERQRVMQKSAVYGVYEKHIDRESAYEILSERMEQTQLAKETAKHQKEEDKIRQEQEKSARQKQREQERLERQKQREWNNSPLGSLTKMATTKAKREGVNMIFKLGRGLLGSLLK